MPTKEQCKKILFNLGIKHGVSPRLISERLLSQDDKQDMLDGNLTEEVLDIGVKLWKEHGMCNYSDGTGTPYKPKDDLPMSRYRGNGKSGYK